MHQTGTRWLVILGLLSWAATAAGAQPESGARNTESLEPVPADLRITDDPTFAPAACSTGGYQRAVVPRWWHDRLKSCLQYSHWGYADEFEEIPFGPACERINRLRSAAAGRPACGCIATTSVTTELP